MSGHTSSPDDTYCFFASDAITGAGPCQMLRPAKDTGPMVVPSFADVRGTEITRP